jgi:GMP synthase-like glutamine amidotransferase
MKNKLILVIGRHPQIMETVLRLLNQESGFEAIGALADDEAKAKFQSNLFDLILFGGGPEDYSENDLRREFSRINPAIKMIRQLDLVCLVFFLSSIRHHNCQMVPCSILRSHYW